MNVSISHKFITHNKTVIVVTVLETFPVNTVFWWEVGRSCLGDSQLPNNVTVFCDHSNFCKSPPTIHYCTSKIRTENIHAIFEQSVYTNKA